MGTSGQYDRRYASTTRSSPRLALSYLPGTERRGGEGRSDQYQPGAEPLQLQVQLLLRPAGVAPGDELSGYFVPFRSRDWASLKQKAASVAFGERLWTGTLARASVRTIFGVGKGVLGAKLSEILGAQLCRTDPSGWGQLTIDTYRASDGRALILLPNLSRFRLFGRPGGIAEATVAAILKTVSVY